MPEAPTPPPARRSTHVDVGVDEAGTPLVSGSDQTSRGSRRANPATKPIPIGASRGFGAAPTAGAAPAAGAAPRTIVTADPASDGEQQHRNRKPAIIVMCVAITTLLAGLGFVTASIASVASF